MELSVESLETPALTKAQLAELLFDVYRSKTQKADAEVSGGLAAGEKSLAVRLTLNSADAPLTEAQIEASVQAVLAQLVSHLGARLRA